MHAFIKFAFIAGLGFLIAAEVAYGQTQTYGTNDPGIQKRMENQERRIDQGVQSGALTPKEAGKLEAEQARIRQAEQRMKADGQLTPGERERLRKMQDRSSRHIYRQKHDAQTVGAGGTNDPGIQKRMENQERRIDQGVQSGELTPKEAGKLEAEQARIRQAESRMKSDGDLSPQERRRLHNMQDRASDHIYRQKHDRQKVNTR
ncbi:MAG: hypothetical protein HPY67_07745 [Syntrophaceae bacterium]|nr:hypothetical protein [Syntrophaceae bacterium]